MVGSGNLDQMHIFFFSARAFNLGSHVVSAEDRRNGIVCAAMNQVLASMREGKMHRIGLPIVIRNFHRSSAKKLDDGVMAEMKLIRALQVYDSRQRDRTFESGLVGCQAERQLASCRVSHYDDALRVEVMLRRILYEELIRRAQIGECSWPSTALIPHPPVL